MRTKIKNEPYRPKDPHEKRVTFCRECDFWEKGIGTTARKCGLQGRYTRQFDYCSEAVEVRFDETR